jgi:hypothetical protein
MYQHKFERLSFCPLTIHTLLHIADSIKAIGPVWCYWAFPMECYCGTLQQSIHSRRFPFASLDHFIIETVQLNQISTLYAVANVLALRAPSGSGSGYIFSDAQCMFIAPEHERCMLTCFSKDLSCVLLPLKSQARPANHLIASIAGALATRFHTDVATVKRHLRNLEIEEWGKVCRVDSDAGDTMIASSLVVPHNDTRDATYVRVR